MDSTNSSNIDIRWQQRFDNFSNAYLLLKEICETDISQLDEKSQQVWKEATIQRFEYTLDLAWKVLKDKMEYDGINLSNVSPKFVIRTAFNANYINTYDVGDWMAMIDDRNDTSHDYERNKFEAIFIKVKSIYLPLFTSFYDQHLPPKC